MERARRIYSQAEEPVRSVSPGCIGHGNAGGYIGKRISVFARLIVNPVNSTHCQRTKCYSDDIVKVNQGHAKIAVTFNVQRRLTMWGLLTYNSMFDICHHWEKGGAAHR